MTIAAAPSRAQVAKEDMNAGGMAERARIIKTALMTLFPLIEKQNVLIVLLNQVISEIGAWRPGFTSGGGNALQHDIHMRLEVNGGKTEYDGPYPIVKYSDISIAKSKISPIIQKFPIIIDITKGGVIDRASSLVWWIANLSSPNVFKQSAWWSIEEWCYNKYKPYWDKFSETLGVKFRQSKLYEFAHKCPDFLDFLQLIWLDLISEKYELQRDVCTKLHDEVKARLIVNTGIIETPENETEQEQNTINTEELDLALNSLEGN